MKVFRRIVVFDIFLTIITVALIYFTGLPGVVCGCDATADKRNASVSWTEAEGPSLYFVYRAAEGEPFMCVGKSRTASFKDKDLVPGTVYRYKIKAFNGRRMSDASEPVEIVTGLDTPELKVDISQGVINLEASDVVSAEEYVFFRNGKEIGRSSSSLCDEKAELDEEYKYSVKAVKGDIESDMSKKVSASLVSPGAIKTELVGDNVKISWSGNDRYNKYKLYDVPEGSTADDNSLICETTDRETTIDAGNKEHHLVLYGFGDDITSPTSTSNFVVTEEPLSSSEAAENAVKWAIDIANDDSFNYGKKGSNGPGYANRCGCYFCGTNDKKVKLSGDDRYYKTWPCMPFITAAYAHGAGDPEVLKTCQSCHTLETNDNNWHKYDCFEFVGRMSELSVSDLQVGDILVHYDEHNGSSKKGGHMSMYAGDGNIVDSSGGGWAASSIALREGRAESYLRGKWNAEPSKNYVMRYVGHGSGSKKVIKKI